MEDKISLDVFLIAAYVYTGRGKLLADLLLGEEQRSVFRNHMPRPPIPVPFVD